MAQKGPLFAPGRINLLDMVSPLGILNLFTVLFLVVAAFGYLVFGTTTSWKDELFLVILATLTIAAHLVLRFGLLAPLQRLQEFFRRVDQVKASPQDFQLKFTGQPQLLYDIFVKLIFTIVNATNFVNELINGKLDVEYRGAEASQPERYKLVGALLKLRQQTQEFVLSKRETDWVTQGFANFVEVLRTDDTGMEQLSNRILEQLVKYLGAAYGLFYDTAERDGQTVLRLTACYAYERAQLGKEVWPGEDLVGQAYRDKNIIHLTKLPQGYLPVASGLGQAPPKEVVIVPAIVNNQVFAMLELASLEPFLPHQLEFMRKLGENIAATVAGLKSNERTHEMLEASESQAEMLRAQEEMLRQGLEGYLMKEQELEREKENMMHQARETFETQRQLLEQELTEREAEIARLKALLATQSSLN
jgi:methyl-accepting chemotaxis protein